MIVLDTHIWLWWINGESRVIGENRRQLIQGEHEVAVSAISCFEVAWLNKHGRIELPCSPDVWFEKALGGSGIMLLSISPAIAAQAVALPEHHSDPQDRLIIATALRHEAKLMSDDRKFAQYAELNGRLI